MRQIKIIEEKNDFKATDRVNEHLRIIDSLGGTLISLVITPPTFSMSDGAYTHISIVWEVKTNT